MHVSGILPQQSQTHTRDAIALRVTIIMGQTGRYLETRRAVVPLMHVSITFPLYRCASIVETHLVVKTRMAPAFCSKLALTAAMAHVSVVGQGMGASFRNSSN